MSEGDDVERAPETAEGEEDRTYPSTIGGALYIVMLAVITVGLLVVVLGPWRIGIRIFAGALVGGAALRLSLKERDAGMLSVRNKPIDAGIFLTVAVALLVLSSSIPDQPV